MFDTATIKHRSGRRRLVARRRGAVLVEFAFVALIIYLMLAAILSFGRLLWIAQVLQQSTDLFARELSRTPLPANDTLAEAMADADVEADIYNDDHLVIDITDQLTSGKPLMQWLDEDFDADPVTAGAQPLPTVNKMLIPLMVLDTAPGLKAPGTRTVLRYPGVLLDVDGTAFDTITGYLVMIPIVTSRDASTGEETGITLVEVVEEIDDDTTDAVSPHQISDRAMVALRMRYPFQSGLMSMRLKGIGWVVANDPSPAPGNQPAGSTVVTGGNQGSDNEFGIYSGRGSLGAHAKFTDRIRPFRRVLMSQAIYRREVYR